MIQDIYPHRLDNQFQPDRKPEANSMIFTFRGRHVMIRELGETFRMPVYAELGLTDEQALTFLFEVDGTACFYCREDIEPGDTFRYIPMNALYESYHDPKYLTFALMTAYQLANWYRKNRFCGCCGQETAHVPAERALRCTACGTMIFPKVVPAVIVAITRGDELLLTRYRDRPEVPYALIAGFTEIGETLEETVRREAMEETGLRVKNIRYYGSQPWGIVDDILAAFVCEAEEGDELKVDEQELKEAVWLHRDEITIEHDDFSITNAMIVAFKENRL